MVVGFALVLVLMLALIQVLILVLVRMLVRMLVLVLTLVLALVLVCRFVALHQRLRRAPAALCPHRHHGVATSSASTGAARASALRPLTHGRLSERSGRRPRSNGMDAPTRPFRHQMCQSGSV